MDSDEKEVGSALAVLRAGVGMSQAELARQMLARGWQWAQATVTNVESGTRPLRLREAATLADMFGCPIDVFLGDGTGRRAISVVHSRCNEIRERERELIEASRRLAALQLELTEAVDSLPESEQFDLGEARACLELNPSAIVERSASWGR